MQFACKAVSRLSLSERLLYGRGWRSLLSKGFLSFGVLVHELIDLDCDLTDEVPELRLVRGTRHVKFKFNIIIFCPSEGTSSMHDSVVQSEAKI